MHSLHQWRMRVGTGRYSDNRCSDKVRTVASERNQHCRGKVGSKPKGLSRGEVLGSGGKPLPTIQGIGERCKLLQCGHRVVPVGGKAPADMSFIAFWVLQ